MALRDPGMLEFARLINTEELATDFARDHGLLLFNQQLMSIYSAILNISCMHVAQTS